MDRRLGGGLSEGSVVLLYGEPETGKTTLSIQCAVSCARMNCKTLFIDCDSTFFPKRMEQIAREDLKSLAPQIILIKPESFEQQTYVIDNLGEYVGRRVGLIVVDTVTGLYRKALGGSLKTTFTLNRELNRQMACITQIVKTMKIFCLVVSQVRSMVSGEEDVTQPVATRVLRFWADTTISLKPTAKNDTIKAIVKTRNGNSPAEPILLEINQRGLVDARS